MPKLSCVLPLVKGLLTRSEGEKFFPLSIHRWGILGLQLSTRDWKWGSKDGIIWIDIGSVIVNGADHGIRSTLRPPHNFLPTVSETRN